MGISKISDKKKGKKAVVNILKDRSSVLNISISFMHVCVCVYVCVHACAHSLGCQLVVTTTLCYGCEKVIHNVITTCPQHASESTFLRFHNVGSQRADYENMTCTQHCHNVELFAGYSKCNEEHSSSPSIICENINQLIIN